MRQAIILAGGKGTRLADRLDGRPKPLVDVLGKPLLLRQLEQLVSGGFDRFLILANHRIDQIEAFVAQLDMKIEVEVVDDGKPRGTAGALLASLNRCDPEFAVVYGDTLFEVDFARFIEAHDSAPAAAATLFLHPNSHPQDSDLVDLNADGRIRAFYPKPHPPGVWRSNMVNAALYLMRRSALTEYTRLAVPSDLARDLFPQMLHDGLALNGYVSSEYIKDVGTPERLDQACRALAAGIPARATLKSPQRAVFVDRDGTLNRPAGHISDPSALELFPGVGAAIRRLNDAEWRVIMVTNQPVIARGEASAEDVRTINAKLEMLIAANGAYLDRIYLCPHHPDKGFPGEVPELKVDCACRKPKPGLIFRARDELAIDLSQSWFIGDTDMDVAAARASGVRAIAVKTGTDGGHAAEQSEPDFVVESFSDAVATVLARDACAELQRP